MIDFAKINFDLMPHIIRGYESIWTLKKSLRKHGVKANAPDLLALSGGNDPFYAGTEGHKEKAKWFVKQLENVGLNIPGVHLRRVHYRLVSQDPPPLLWDNKPYQNDKASWSALGLASKSARYLGLVDVENFDDHRNPEPTIFMNPDYWIDGDSEEKNDPSIQWNFNNVEEYWNLPTINTELADCTSLWYLPDFSVDGYEYSNNDQPFVVEIWIEKSTMEDVILPICRKYSVNYVPGVGFQSITGSIKALKRIAKFAMQGKQKPLRILYITDFDPGGFFMPDGVARQLEFWLNQFAPNSDVKLNPLALTHDQVKHYNLPTTPIKETDKRMEKFKARFNVDGAVELDALEALRPGELKKIVESAITPYRDSDLRDNLFDSSRDAHKEVESVWESHKDKFNDRLDAIKERTKTIIDSYESELNSIAERLAGDFDKCGISDDLEELKSDILNAANNLVVYLPERPSANIQSLDESSWLFASDRHYLKQLQFYKERRQGIEDLEDAA